MGTGNYQLGQDAGSYAVQKYAGSNWKTYYNGSASVIAGAPTTALAANDVWMFAYKAGSLYWGLNGTWYPTGANPYTGTNPVFTGIGLCCPAMSGYYNIKDQINFGQGGQTSLTYDSASGGRFTYTPPAGFKALCTANLPSTMPVVTSGTFTGNANADGPFVWLGGAPTDLTINGNTVTWGTHADKLANGFKVRTSSASYNAGSTNSFSATVPAKFKWATARTNP
jgi:hypothetical protein